jgi:hypothetical protein
LTVPACGFRGSLVVRCVLVELDLDASVRLLMPLLDPW